MTRELIVKVWCDLPHEHDANIEARTVSFSLDGRAEREIDLCADHEREFVEPLRQLYSDARKPDGVTAKATATGYPLECIYCGAGYESAGGLLMHAGTVHGFASTSNKHYAAAEDVYGLECPLCEYVAAIPSTLGRHGKNEHGTDYGTAGLYTAAIKSDPRGVIAKLRRRTKVANVT